MNKEITITMTVEERWISHFCSMLKEMEKNGIVGHSSLIGFYSDGDGDFRPKFTISEETKTEYGCRNTSKIPEIVFDAK